MVTGASWQMQIPPCHHIDCRIQERMQQAMDGKEINIIFSM